MEFDFENFSHLEMCSAVEASINDLTKNDPLLADLPSEPSLAEVQSQIAVEYGQSISLYLQRPPLATVKLAVVNNSTVSQLKRAIEQQVGRHIQREGKHTTHLSWKYFWRKHWITHNGVKLTDDNKIISEYNLRNKDTLTFTKRLKLKHNSY